MLNFFSSSTKPISSLYTTNELRSLSKRIINSQDEILVYASAVLTATIMEDIRSSLKYLYKAAHTVSWLDMLHSLATYARRTQGVGTKLKLLLSFLISFMKSVIPEMTADGPLALHLAVFSFYAGTTPR
jgi:hypothetical protein